MTQTAVTHSAQSKHGGARVRLPPPIVFAALMGAGFAVDLVAWPLALPIPMWPRIVAGVVLTLAGLALLLAANQWFRRTGQHPAPWTPSPELLVAGVYRHTRNPMYVGMTLLQIGFGVAANAPLVAILALVGLAIVHVTAVLREEAYLAEKFGDAYASYRASVRRYL